MAPASLPKRAPNKLSLYGTNTFTGGVKINAGTVTLDNVQGLGPAASATISFGPGSTGALDLNSGYAVTVVGLNTDATTVGTPVVENGGISSADSLTVNNATANTFAGVLQNGEATHCPSRRAAPAR